MNIDRPYTMHVQYPDGRTMTCNEADAEPAIQYAREQLEAGHWKAAELSDHRGELVWAGRHKQGAPN